MTMIKLVAISGSLRAASANTAVLRTIQGILPDHVQMEILSLDSIPFYNQDLDGPNAPHAVQRFKAAIEASDGLIVCSPEYNFGMSGVLKNALDWASRPAFASPLKGKHVLILSASPAFTGGVRAHAQLRDTFAGTLSRVLPRPPVVIASVHTKIQDGRLVDPDNLKFVLEAVADLVQEICSNRLATA
jgi:chromate reductase